MIRNKANVKSPEGNKPNFVHTLVVFFLNIFKVGLKVSPRVCLGNLNPKLCVLLMAFGGGGHSVKGLLLLDSFSQRAYARCPRKNNFSFFNLKKIWST